MGTQEYLCNVNSHSAFAGRFEVIGQRKKTFEVFPRVKQ